MANKKDNEKETKNRNTQLQGTQRDHQKTRDKALDENEDHRHTSTTRDPLQGASS